MQVNLKNKQKDWIKPAGKVSVINYLRQGHASAKNVKVRSWVHKVVAVMIQRIRIRSQIV